MKVILMVNSECNSKCQHCYIDYSESKTPENTLKTVKELQSQTHEVIIAGSETLLNPNYLISYKQAGQNYILTNGILLEKNPALFETIKYYGIEQIGLSLHFGIENELRSVSEKSIKKVISLSNERNLKTFVNTTVTSQNYSGLQDICEKTIEYGATQIRFGRFIGIGKGKNRFDLNLNDTQVKEFFEQVDELREVYDKETLEIKIRGYFGPKPGSKGEDLAKKNTYCPAGINQVVISPDDLVYSCPFLIRKDLAIGRYEKGKILLRSEILPGLRDRCIAQLLSEMS